VAKITETERVVRYTLELDENEMEWLFAVTGNTSGAGPGGEIYSTIRAALRRDGELDEFESRLYSAIDTLKVSRRG
jgi:hypothetical protein